MMGGGNSLLKINNTVGEILARRVKLASEIQHEMDFVLFFSCLLMIMLVGYVIRLVLEIISSRMEGQLNLPATPNDVEEQRPVLAPPTITVTSH